jgi:hypothetical protein
MVSLTLTPSALAQNPNRPIKDKWAVIIGIGKFRNNQIPQLKFPAKDAKDLREFLVSKGNFKRDHILLLTDESATKESIEDAFGDGWLPKRVFEDDLVLVFVSSHGSPKDVKGDNFIIAHDTDPSKPFSTGIRLQTLASDVTRRTGCDRVVLLLDACHSGTAVSDAKGMTRTGIDPEGAFGVGQLVISSSKPEQVSWESKRYQNGVFTRKLIDALQVKGPETKIDEAYTALKDGVEAEVRFDRTVAQTPMFLSKWQGATLALCAPPSSPRFVPNDAPPAPVASPSHTTIAATPVSPAQPIVRSPLTPVYTPPLNTPPVNTSPVTAAPVSAPVTTRANTPPANPVPVNTAPAFAPPYTTPSAGWAALSGNRGLLKAPMMTTHWRADGGDVTLESGTRLISESELAGLSLEQVEIVLNEPFARHGRGFLLEHVRSYYRQQPWYKEDPDYHFRPGDPKGNDDPKIINERRTPKQWANVSTARRVRARLQGKKPAAQIPFGVPKKAATPPAKSKAKVQFPDLWDRLSSKRSNRSAQDQADFAMRSACDTSAARISRALPSSLAAMAARLVFLRTPA